MLLVIVTSGIYNIKRLTDSANMILRAKDRFWRSDARKVALARDVYSRLVDKTRIFAFVGGLLLIHYFFQLLAGYLNHLQDQKVIQLYPESLEIMDEMMNIFILLSLAIAICPQMFY